MPQKRTELALNAMVAIAAVVVALVALRRDLRSADSLARAMPVPVFRADSAAVRSVGIEVANSSAPMKIVVFLDLECPACRLFHVHELAEFRRKSQRDAYSLQVVHLPLRMHANALAAARGAECADGMGRFEHFIDAVLQRQNAIGSVSWVSFARDAGISDSTSFLTCMGRTEEFARIAGGQELAHVFGVRATPSVMVNGWLLPAPPTAAQLLGWAREIEAGRNPFDPSGE